MSARVVRDAIESYRDSHQDPVVERASELFRELTCAAFAELVVDWFELSAK